MGSGGNNKGSHHHVNFHLHIPHLHGFHHHEKKDLKDIPKGCLAIMVGQGEEQQRFVIPVIYINHPLFMQLLKVAEDEYGFDQKGPITIPCHVEEFRNKKHMEPHKFEKDIKGTVGIRKAVKGCRWSH
ncbi:auxin-induced protein X15-like [Gossypium australe]|uniref:Auxin-induced protein X15-like n=1 Tax=Gossypium australe TaxID=47621 RepID=A0A5B6URV9_9ROSI|nr:auxin-induced protein X15-like [Gossypium australe]